MRRQPNKPKAISSVEQNLVGNVDSLLGHAPQLQNTPIRRRGRFQRFKSSLRTSILAWLLAIVSVIVVSVTVWLALKIAYVPTHVGTFGNYTADLKLLRALAEVNTVLLTALTAMSARAAIWAASSTRHGVSMSTWLAMSPATGLFGLTKPFWWRQQKGQDSRDWHRLCCAIRSHLFRFEFIPGYFFILLFLLSPFY